MATRVGVARGLAGCSPAMDNLAAELGLRLQCMGCTLQAEHLRGTLNVDADALRRLTQGSSVPVCLQHVLRVHPLVRDDSWCWARPKLRRFRHLRVTSHVNALFCLHSTTSHQLSSENCCFAVLSVQIMWSARQSQDEGASAVPLTSRLWCHRQGSLLPLHELASLPQADEPWTPNSPVGPKDTSLIAIWWLLQEIEAAAIICEDVSIGIVRRRTTLPLTVFKAGCTGEGCATHPRGVLRCVCRPRMPFSRRGSSARSRCCPRRQASHVQCSVATVPFITMRLRHGFKSQSSVPLATDFSTQLARFWRPSLCSCWRSCARGRGHGPLGQAHRQAIHG